MHNLVHRVSWQTGERVGTGPPNRTFRPAFILQLAFLLATLGNYLERLGTDIFTFYERLGTGHFLLGVDHDAKASLLGIADEPQGGQYAPKTL